MSYEPLLSIITVSAFDAERLSKTLHSLIGLPSLVEHVIVIPENDAESKTLSKLYEYSGHNRINLAHDQQKGIYAAMNVGALVAKGKYVCFWNAGDKLHNRKDLMVLLERLIELNPIWAIAQGQFEWRTKQELSLANLLGFLTHQQDTFISHQTIFVAKKNFMDIGMFNTQYQVAADTDQITRLFSIEPPVFENSVVVQVEAPNFAARNHRRARFEVLIIALCGLVGIHRINAIQNILRHEIDRINRKFK